MKDSLMIYLNNRIVPQSRALVSVFDHGFLYGDGVYETVRAYNGVVFMFDEHIERLFRSASLIALKISRTPEEIKQAAYAVIKANKQRDAVIRITVSRGAGPVGLDPALCPKPTFVIISNPFREYPAPYYRKGTEIAIVNTRRNFRYALDPQIKSLNFLNNILAKIEAKNRGAYEAIMLDYRGYIAEGTISNIFFVREQVLHTPSISVGILNGITRNIVLETAGKLGIGIKEGKFRKEDLFHAEEVFISNTTMEVMPVAKVDDIKIGAKPGKITRQLRAAYKKKVGQYIKRESANA